MQWLSLKLLLKFEVYMSAVKIKFFLLGLLKLGRVHLISVDGVASISWTRLHSMLCVSDEVMVFFSLGIKRT